MIKWWEAYGLFVPGVWTVFDDLMVFGMFMGGVTLVTIAALLSAVVPGMRIMMSLGFLLWIMLAIYVQDLRKTVFRTEGKEK